MSDKQLLKYLHKEAKKLSASFDKAHAQLSKKLGTVIVNELFPLAKCISSIEDTITELETSTR